MIFTKTKIEGVFIITQEQRIDKRGYFSRIFAKEELKIIGIPFEIAHINRSLTFDKGTVRGMHYQIRPKQEDKIVQCINGKVFDVALDLRRESKTYGKWIGEELSGKNRKMLLLPKGVAHGFQTLEDNTELIYHHSQYYKPGYEAGIKYSDPKVNIKWPGKITNISNRDNEHPLLDDNFEGLKN